LRQLNQYSPEQIAQAVKAKGHPLFTGFDRHGKFRAHDLTIVGIRNDDPGQEDSNRFNDDIIIFDPSTPDRTDCWIFPGTTDPGTKGRLKPSNSAGLAILVPGHYKSCWGIGMHQNKYPALRQIGPMDFWRDNDKDGSLKLSGAVDQDDAFIGCNFHHASYTTESKFVDNWSLACQVLARNIHWNLAWGLITDAGKNWGDKFSYTLMLKSDLKPYSGAK